MYFSLRTVTFNHKNVTGPKVSDWAAGYRDFDTTEEMNERLIEAMNVAKPDDVIYHLGDVCMGPKSLMPALLDKIQCRNIHLIVGNHDIEGNKLEVIKYRFKSIQTTWEGKINSHYFYLHHYAQRVWNHSHEGSLHCFGHSHGSLPDDPNSLSIDVGFDTNLFDHEKYTMYHYDEIVEIMKKKDWKPVDHHR